MNVIQGFIELTYVLNETKFMVNVDYLVEFYPDYGIKSDNKPTIIHVKQQDMTGATFQKIDVRESYQQVKDLISMASQAGSTQVHI